MIFRCGVFTCFNLILYWSRIKPYTVKLYGAINFNVIFIPIFEIRFVSYDKTSNKYCGIVISKLHLMLFYSKNEHKNLNLFQPKLKLIISLNQVWINIFRISDRKPIHNKHFRCNTVHHFSGNVIMMLYLEINLIIFSILIFKWWINL